MLFFSFLLQKILMLLIKVTIQKCLQHSINSAPLTSCLYSLIPSWPLHPHAHTGDNGTSSLARPLQTLLIILHHNAAQLLEERLWDPVTIVPKHEAPYAIIHDYRPNFQKESQEESKTHYIYFSLSWIIFHLIQ